MKKLVLSAMLVASAFTTISAQEVSYGVKAGLNISNIIGDGTDDLDSKEGFNIGGFIEAPVSGRLFIQPELSYSTQGTKSEFSEKLKLDYINVPLLLKYYVTDGLNLCVGPQLGILTSAKIKSKRTSSDRVGNIIFDSEEVEDVRDDIISIDFSAVFGLGYQFGKHFLVDARYNLGLSNINDFDEDGSKIRNSVFQFSVGYKF